MKAAFARCIFIGIFSIPKNDPGSLSQLADNIPKLNPARPNKKNIAEIPPSSTIAISALFFLLGLAGLSFGILSASWDKEPGSFFGIENIPMNIQRAKAAFKPATQNFEKND